MTPTPESYLSTLLQRPGAVEAQGPDQGVAAHYGDPTREQRALARGRAVVDHSHRGVVTVSGVDRLTWLTTLSSQVFTTLRPGDSTEALFLTLQGRVELAPHAVDDGTTTWLLTEPEEAALLTQWLDSMRFASRVEVKNVSDSYGVLSSTRELSDLLEGSADSPESALVPVTWQDPWPGVSTGGYAYSTEVEHPGAARAWFEHVVCLSELDALVDRLASQDIELAGAWAAEALRIEAWRPRWGVDTDEKTIPHELDWMRTAVHLEKGCYKGQETVARVHNLGHPPRRLVFLDLDGSQHTLPQSGAPVTFNGKTVGRVTAAQLHYEAGPVALAVIKRSVDPQAELLVIQSVGEDAQDSAEEWAAAQTVVVSPDAGNVVGRPQGFLRGPRGGGLRP